MRQTDLDNDIVKMRSRVFAFCTKLIKDPIRCEDLVQAAVLKALMKQDQFEKGTSLFAWMCTIAKNLWLAGIAQTKGRSMFGPRCFVPLEYNPDDEHSDIDQKYHTRPNQEAYLMLKEVIFNDNIIDTPSEVHHNIKGNINKLSFDIMLKSAMGDTYDELAAEYNVPIGTIRSRINRARTFIQNGI